MPVRRGKIRPVKVVIHDRTERLPANLRSYAEQKLDKLTRHFDRVLDAELHFDEERRSSRERLVTSRILVHASGRKAPLLKAEEKAADERAALDLALDKIDRQVVKLKERRRDRHGPPAAAITVSESSERPLPPMDTVRRHIKPESVEQARRHLDSNGMDFHLFVNEDSGEVNVIYRRPDGGLRVIEPILK